MNPGSINAVRPLCSAFTGSVKTAAAETAGISRACHLGVPKHTSAAALKWSRESRADQGSLFEEQHVSGHHVASEPDSDIPSTASTGKHSNGRYDVLAESVCIERKVDPVYCATAGVLCQGFCPHWHICNGWHVEQGSEVRAGESIDGYHVASEVHSHAVCTIDARKLRGDGIL